MLRVNLLAPASDNAAEVVKNVLAFDYHSDRFPDFRLRLEVAQWCSEHIGKWKFQSPGPLRCWMLFENEADALAFRLRWL